MDVLYQSVLAQKTNETQTIVDETETNLVAFRRTVYLTIQSSLDFQECAHKLLKMNMKPGMEVWLFKDLFLFKNLQAPI